MYLEVHCSHLGILGPFFKGISMGTKEALIIGVGIYFIINLIITVSIVAYNAMYGKSKGSETRQVLVFGLPIILIESLVLAKDTIKSKLADRRARKLSINGGNQNGTDNA